MQTTLATFAHMPDRWTIRASRAQESWALRQLAQILLSEGRTPGARSFAVQALLTYPTLGAVRLAIWTVIASFRDKAPVAVPQQ